MRPAKILIALSLICAAIAGGSALRILFLGKTSHGFVPSQERNVFLIRKWMNGATAFIAEFPKLGVALVTQQHVLRLMGSQPTLYSGYTVGPFFWSRALLQDAFQLSFTPEILFEDEKLDLVLMKVPPELLAKCKCAPLRLSEKTQSQTARLLGYPILGRRTAPLGGRYWTRFGELLGRVEQMASQGSAQTGTYGALTTDAISGNSGGPVLDEEGKLLGVLYRPGSSVVSGYDPREGTSTWISFAELIKQRRFLDPL